MGAFDSIFRTMASVLTKTFGGSGTLSRSVTVYDETTDIESPATTFDLPIACTPPEKFDQTRIDNVNILGTDLQVSVPAMDVRMPNDQGVLVETIPENETWSFTFHGERYLVYRVSPTYSGDLPALLELQLRR